MPEFPDHLPHLLKLLDDEDPEVRAEVFRAMSLMGNNLEHQLTPFLEQMPPPQLELIQRWTAEIRIKRFQENWLEWLDMEEETAALETALGWISYLEAEWAPEPLPDLIDQLARIFREKYEAPDIPNLMQFLFIDQGFSSPEKEYYHPRNSNLITVIHRRRGLQISLAAIGILVAQRVGIHIRGFNMPGHFMLMARQGEEIRLFDVFNQGKALPVQAYSFLEHSLSTRNISTQNLEAQTYQIVARVLRNFINAFERRKESDKARFFKGIHNRLIEELRERGRIVT